MASQGPLSPGTKTSGSNIDGVWDLVTGGVMTWTGGGGSNQTATLDLTNYGFSIPPFATINGIQVDFTRDSSPGNHNVTDNTFQLSKVAGTGVGSNLADFSTLYPLAFTDAVHGGSANLWGTTWSPSDINGSGFGIHYIGQINLDNYIKVSAATITVFYTNPAPTCTNCVPGNGTTAGGTSVTLTGSNFYGSPTVTFGGVAATSVVVVNGTTITCVTPAGSGLVNIVVTNPDGQTGTFTNGYQYAVNASTTAASLSSATSVHAPSNAVSAGITGVSSTTHVGTVFTPEAVVGVSSTTSVGQVGGSVSTPVGGKSSTTSVGTATVAVSPATVSLSSTTSVGAPTYTGTATFNLTGLRTTSSMGVPAAAGISQAIIGWFQVG